MFNTYRPTHNSYNSLNINAVSGMLVKNHPKSFMVQCCFGSKIANRLFNTEKPTFAIEHTKYRESRYGCRESYKEYEYKDVVVLQTLLCGDDRVMCEVVFKEDWDELMTCGNAE